jgi:hypothetical protein
MLAPRMACKLFYDGCYILDQTAQNEKYLQDRIPEGARKFYKKKQWRKQFIDAGRRVCCRLAKGLNFSPNCPAEECFVHVIMRDTFELGWRRIQNTVDNLPESDKDRDFARVARLACNEDIGYLYKVSDLDSTSKEGGKIVDYKSWFKAFQTDASRMHDHMMM